MLLKVINTPNAIGMEYQNAVAPIVTKTINICSGPYATDERASEDRMANAFVLLSFCSPSSLDFNGRPIKNLFMDPSMFISPPSSDNRVSIYPN